MAELNELKMMMELLIHTIKVNTEQVAGVPMVRIQSIADEIEEAQKAIASNAQCSRNDFMEFFRSDDLHEKLTDDDCVEVFMAILKGGSDITKKRLLDIGSDYGVDIPSLFQDSSNETPLIELKEDRESMELITGESITPEKFLAFKEWLDHSNFFNEISNMLPEFWREFNTSVKSFSIRCNNCYKLFANEDDLEILTDKKDADEHFKGCPNCKTDHFLMDGYFLYNASKS